MKILLRDLNAKLGKEDIFEPTVWNESLHRASNDNAVRVVNFTTSKSLDVKSTMFLHRNIHKYTWISLDGKTHNQVDHILTNRKWHSSVLDYEVAGELTAILITFWWLKVRERLTVSKLAAQKFDVERFNLRSQVSWRLGNSIILRSKTVLQLWGTLTLART